MNRRPQDVQYEQDLAEFIQKELRSGYSAGPMAPSPPLGYVNPRPVGEKGERGVNFPRQEQIND